MAGDRTQRQRVLDGDLYIAEDAELAADALRARRPWPPASPPG